MNEETKTCDAACMRRRGFLQVTATGVTTMLMAEVFPGRVFAQDADTKVQVAKYPRIAIAKLADLKQDVPVTFNYPSDADHTICLLIKLGTKAGGGVGEDQDIVAFSARCTHMGVTMEDGYIAEHKLMGCDEHLSTFDLTRHGMMVVGHATTRLPQVILEIENDQIYATGISGLLYGYSQNPVAEAK